MYSEKAGLPPNAVKNTYVQLHDWSAKLGAEVAVSANNVAKGRGKAGKGAKLPQCHRHMITKDAIYGISSLHSVNWQEKEESSGCLG